MTHVFKNGDKVMVIDHRPADAHEHPVWTDPMDKFIGRTGIVKQVIDRNVVRVAFSDGTAWFYKLEWIMPIKVNTSLIQHKKLLTTIKLY